MNLNKETPAPRKLSTLVIVSLVCVLTLLVFFRQQVLNHFTYLSGDPYDGVIQVALLEHWFNFFKGMSHWASPNYFYPYPKTLGYNEGLFLYGVIYSIFRALAIDPFLSSELVNIVIKGIGFFGFFAACRQLLKLSPAWAMLGAIVFTLSNNSFVQTSHAQLLSVSLAPVAAVLIHTAYTALMASRTSRFFAYGSLAALWFAAWLLTCLYTAWFFTMFLAITVVVQLCVLGRPGLAALGRALAANRGALVGVAVVAALALLPFAAIYFSAGNAIKHRPWEEILYYTPSLFDSVNVGSGNLLFGGVVDALKGGCAICNIGSGEREAGISPILFVLAWLCVSGIVTRTIVVPAPAKAMVVGLALASAAMWLLSVRFGAHSGWYFVYKFWPGGSGLRVVARVFLFLSVPATALAVFYLSQSTRPRLVVLALCFAVVFEQLNGAKTTTLDRFHALDRLASVGQPPASCKAFFATASIDTVDNDPGFPVGSIYPHNVDAMLIAELVNLPTINGFASFNPPDWNFQYPSKPDYSLRVAQYAKGHGLQGLCKLDLISKRWDADPVLTAAAPSLATWDFASDTVTADVLSGFGDVEPLGRWSIGNAASLKFNLPPDAKRETWKIQIDLVTTLVNDNHAQRVIVSVNGGERKEFLIKSTARRNIAVVVPASPDGRGEINLAFPDAISPKELGINPDVRKLAVRVKSIEIQ